MCPECALLPIRALPDGRGRAKWTTNLLLANVVGDSLSIVAGLATMSGGPNADTGLSTVLDAIAGLVTFGALVGGAITFLRWLHLAVRTTVALGHQVGMTPGWACGFFFVPIANLYKPYRAVNAMATSLSGHAQSAPVGAWWAAWIANNVLSQIQFRITMSSPASASSTGVLFLGFFANSLSIIAALLCIRVVASIQKELSARREPASPAGPVVPVA